MRSGITGEKAQLDLRLPNTSILGGNPQRAGHRQLTAAPQCETIDRRNHRPGIPGLTQIAPGAPPTDTLKINLGVAPNPHPSRFGVLAGDTQGFPNGRRLTDDVVDISERVVGGFLKGNKLPLGDGVDQNDKAFRASFPYVASPAGGFDSQLKRTEPAHAPVPGDPTGSR